MPGRLIAAEKPSGKGGVPVEMGPDLNSIARTSAGGKGPAKAETEPMGLERYAEVDRTEGVIRDLFVDNTGKCSGSDELVALTGQVIDAIGNNMERLTVLGALGRGKCGRVDEVQLADLLEGSYALKTIREVSRARMKWMNTLTLAESWARLLAIEKTHAGCFVFHPLTSVLLVMRNEAHSSTLRHRATR